MASADIGLQVLENIPAFYYGTSPNKFFDYISAGLPVLNNYPGWLSELINEYDCGFTVLPDDTTSFSDTLETIANDRSVLTVKSNNAKKLANEKFDRKILTFDLVKKLEIVHSKKMRHK